MALVSDKEKLADLLTRLHQDAKTFSLVGKEQQEARDLVWSLHDRDLAVGKVPAQTFTCGSDGEHYYAGIAHGESWFIAIFAWLKPERAVNVDAGEISHLVATIPMTDGDHTLATLREIARHLAKPSTPPRQKSILAK